MSFIKSFPFCSMLYLQCMTSGWHLLSELLLRRAVTTRVALKFTSASESLKSFLEQITGTQPSLWFSITRIQTKIWFFNKLQTAVGAVWSTVWCTVTYTYIRSKNEHICNKNLWNWLFFWNQKEVGVELPFLPY